MNIYIARILFSANVLQCFKKVSLKKKGLQFRFKEKLANR